MRQDCHPSRELPAAKIKRLSGSTFRAELPAQFKADRQVVPLEDFLKAAFDRRLHFGRCVGVEVRPRVAGIAARCSACGKARKVIFAAEFTYGPRNAYRPNGQWSCQISYHQLTAYPQLAAELFGRLPDGVRHEFECAHSSCDPTLALELDIYDFPLAPWFELTPFRLDKQWIEALGGPTDEGWWIEGL